MRSETRSEAPRRSLRLQTRFPTQFPIPNDEDECQMLVDEIAKNIDARNARPNIECEIEDLEPCALIGLLDATTHAIHTKH